jgi:hypothetical protein
MAIGAWATTPGQALADTYADDDSTNATPPCTQANPCNTIQAAVDDAAAGDTVFVDFGDYSETVTVGDDKSLEADAVTPDAESAATVTGSPAVRVAGGQSAGMISGFSFVKGTGSGANGVVELRGDATVAGNDITGFGGGTQFEPGVLITDGAPTVRGNTITHAAGTYSKGIDSVSPASGTELEANSITAVTGIFVGGGGDTTVRSNTVLAVPHPTFMQTTAIEIQDAAATIVANRFTGPGSGDSRFSVGVNAANVTPDGIATEVVTSRNRVSGTWVGYRMYDVTGGVSRGDLAFDNRTGFNAFNNSQGTGEQVIEGLTAWDNTQSDLTVDGIDLTLDSSVVQRPIVIETFNGPVTCAISFSRGPTDPPRPGGCSNFSYTADPGFADSGYHLSSSSPLLDAGNPAAPAATDPGGQSLDIDGDARSIDADCNGAATRDVGADEAPACSAATPDPQPEPQPEPGFEPEPEPKADGTLTIDANKGKVEKGRKVLLSGQLDVAANESCEQNRQILIQRRLKAEDDSKFATFENVSTDAAGNFSTKEKVKKTYFYRAVVGETDACDDETSNSQKVRVQKKKAAQQA